MLLYKKWNIFNRWAYLIRLQVIKGVKMNEQTMNIAKLKYGLKVKIFKNLLFSQAVIYLDTLYDNLLWILTDKSSFLVDLCFTQISYYALEVQLEIKLSSGYKGEYLPKYILAKQFNMEIPILLQEYQEANKSSSQIQLSFQQSRKPSIFDTIQNYIKTKKAACDYSSGFSRCLKKLRLQLELIQSENWIQFSRSSVIKSLNSIQEFSEINKQDILDKQKTFKSNEISKILKIAYCKINLSYLRSLKGSVSIIKFKNMESFLTQKIIDLEGKFFTCFQVLIKLQNKVTGYLIPEYEVEQNLPLTDYFCFSSHNTYLTGNQLTSDCKVARYIEDLRKGIKCVELDVHNRGDDEPIITHALKGKGFCKPILFRHTIQAIDEFLQHYPNHYPIILSIQNHATRQNQDLMYNIIRKEFPKSILIPIDTTQFYTLAQIKGKVIVKTSCDLQSLVQFSHNNQKPKPKHFALLNKNSLQSQQSEQLNTIFYRSSTQTFLNQDTSNFNFNQIDGPEVQNQNYKQFLEKIGKFKRLKVIFDRKIDKSSYLPVQKIVQITCMFKASKGIETQKPNPYQCCSMQNTKIVKTEKQKIITFSKQAWIRSYPEGTQIYSNNYDFLQLLSRGIQIIALNTQTNDDYAIMMNSYFRAGRNSTMETIGFIEKPQYLRLKNDKQKLSFIYPSKRNFQFTFHTNLQLQFTLYSLEKAILQLSKISQKQIKVKFTVGYYNEGFLLIRIGKKWVECLPLRFLPYDKKDQQIKKHIIARDYEFQDTGVKIFTTFKWN